MTKAITAGATPVPMIGIKSSKSARLGMMRIAWNDETINFFVELYRMQRNPAGIQIAIAAASEDMLIQICSPIAESQAIVLF